MVITRQVCVKLSIPPPGEDASEVKFKLRHIDELISLSDGQVCCFYSFPDCVMIFFGGDIYLVSPDVYICIYI